VRHHIYMLSWYSDLPRGLRPLHDPDAAEEA
jgi:hypothetical protein